MLKKAEAVIARSKATKQSPHFSEDEDSFAPGACPEHSEGVARIDSCFYHFQHPIGTMFVLHLVTFLLSRCHRYIQFRWEKLPNPHFHESQRKNSRIYLSR